MLTCAALALFIPAHVNAQQSPQRMHKCTDAKGKVYYTQMPPAECLGRESQELSKSGVVVKKNEAALTPEQAAAREAERESERKKKMEDDLRAKEERRKNTALLNTYPTEKDIDEARARALKEIDDAIKDIEKKLFAMRTQQKNFDKEKEFYANKPLPQKLSDNIRRTEADIKAQENLLEAKKKESGVINARYDEDKRRYLELTTGKPAGTPTSAARK